MAGLYTIINLPTNEFTGLGLGLNKNAHRHPVSFYNKHQANPSFQSSGLASTGGSSYYHFPVMVQPCETLNQNITFVFFDITDVLFRGVVAKKSLAYLIRRRRFRDGKCQYWNTL